MTGWLKGAEKSPPPPWRLSRCGAARNKKTRLAFFLTPPPPSLPHSPARLAVPTTTTHRPARAARVVLVRAAAVSTKTVKIGTRGSPLAMAQAYLTRDLLKVRTAAHAEGVFLGGGGCREGGKRQIHVWVLNRRRRGGGRARARRR